MFVELYKDLIERIATAIPEVKHVDIYNGQYLPDSQGKVDSFPRPAIFIEFLPSAWDQLGEREQQTKLSIALHTCSDDTPADSSTLTDSPVVLDAALSHFEIIDKTQRCFQGWSKHRLASMSRVAFSSAPPVDAMYIHIPVYEANFTDQAGKKSYTMVQAVPGVVTAQIEKYD